MGGENVVSFAIPWRHVASKAYEKVFMGTLPSQECYAISVGGMAIRSGTEVKEHVCVYEKKIIAQLFRFWNGSHK